MTDDRWLARAVDLATANVAAGGGPFGALVVRDGEEVSTGVNRVTRDLDPTAHAEVVAVREACRVLGDFSLAGCTLYTSCEPCPLCVSASLWARLDRVVYAADRDDAARGGFDDRAFYELFETPRTEWSMPVESLPAGTAPTPLVPFAPFEAWLAKADRTHY
ncbi:MAG: tRNA-specific adenosine deaminase [Nocardioides sp.]|nr:tRNA-specific adenosine deaminase [Nocardioides sp.]